MTDHPSRWLYALTFAALACSTPGSEPESTAGTDTAGVRQAIEQVDVQWEQAANRGDAAGVAALYTDDAYFLSPNADIIQGRDAIRNAVQGLIDAKLSNVDFTSVSVGVNGDLAYEVGRYKLSLHPAGTPQPVTDEGKYLIILKKQADGAWKIIADIFNTSQPPPVVR